MLSAIRARVSHLLAAMPNHHHGKRWFGGGTVGQWDSGTAAPARTELAEWRRPTFDNSPRSVASPQIHFPHIPIIPNNQHGSWFVQLLKVFRPSQAHQRRHTFSCLLSISMFSPPLDPRYSYDQPSQWHSQFIKFMDVCFYVWTGGLVPLTSVVVTAPSLDRRTSVLLFLSNHCLH